MPSDLSSSSIKKKIKKNRTTNFPISLSKLILLLIITIFYSLIAIHNSYPPYNWINKFIHRNDSPKAAQFERYSKEHRYRPAASPIIKRVGKNGKVELHGLYHD